ncbi:NAD(P)-dependent oxidoreductase [Occultella gossypii]|uniref:NAD(P)H-binding protein n=1 Tax=Occultella gossypii TaxID=2800820 RepID=A0ABS7SHV6_9MICO|nr:NAD(P)H-binding protein [Occultella gossypii]MBZ2199647.1 NAD(P)H-binding protein [Occultella gossypii]
MRLAVLGASGRTGRELVDHACARGHDVIGVVRDPAKARSDWNSAVAEGTDSAALTEAMTDADAVAFCIGPVEKTDAGVMEKSAIATVQAMRIAGVNRLVLITASGPFDDGDGPFTRYVAKPIVQRILREQFADMVATEAVIHDSGLDWTIVRPPMLTESGARSGYRERRDGNVRGGILIARADLARAMVDLLEDPTTIGESVSVAR